MGAVALRMGILGMILDIRMRGEVRGLRADMDILIKALEQMRDRSTPGTFSGNRIPNPSSTERHSVSISR
jgi:hypothetical protein